MRSCKECLLSLLLVALASGPTVAQRGAPPLDELKREAFSEIDKQQVFTQQMVDQIFSYSELGFQEYEIQTKEIKYAPLISAAEMPAIELNREKMEKFGPQLKKVYFDPNKYKTYLEQLGIRYPTVRN